MSELKRFYRNPKINVTLPTDRQFYNNELIDFSVDNSVPVRAMTGRDELVLKNPDSLLNGDSIIRVIQSCVPEIKNPKLLFAPDIEAILLGIFFSSFGQNLEFKATCPKCSHRNDYELSIRHLLSTAKHIEYPAIVSLQFDSTEVEVFVQPYTFETNTKNQLAMFEQTKMVQQLVNDSNSDADKIKAFSESFEKMAQLKFESVSDCIQKIVINEKVNNEITKTTITDQVEIKEFIANVETQHINEVIKKIDLLNQTVIDNTFDAVCQNKNYQETKESEPKACEHTWKTQVEIDPSNFFAGR